MAWVYVVIALSLIEYFVFVMAVGRARGRFGVAAPATSGNPDFERVYRVQMNTLEQLIIFIPSIWIFGSFVSPVWAAGLGLVFVIGRALYAIGYAKAARKRSLGFAIAGLPLMILMVGSLIGAVLAALR